VKRQDFFYSFFISFAKLSSIELWSDVIEFERVMCSTSDLDRLGFVISIRTVG